MQNRSNKKDLKYEKGRKQQRQESDLIFSIV